MDESLEDTLKRVQSVIDQSGAAGLPDESLSGHSAEDLRAIVIDRGAAMTTRRLALRGLSERWHGDPEFTRLILAVFENDRDELVPDAINLAPSFDAKIREMLRSWIDHPSADRWETAALALARRKDHALLPLLKRWCLEGDRDHRRVGLMAIAYLLIPEDHLVFVELVCEAGPRDDADEEVLIQSLRDAEARVAFWRGRLVRRPSEHGSNLQEGCGL